LQENLNQGLNVVSHISDKTTSLPILNNVLIKSENKTIKLIATNLEIGINCAIRGKVEEDGDTTILARIFSEYIALMPNEKIDMEMKDDSLQVSCSNFSTKLKSSPASDFPLLPSIDKEKSYCCSVAINDFQAAISQVLFAISPNESRPEISGVFISVKNGELTLAGTDSFRLAEKKIKIISGNNKEDDLSTIIPYKTLSELLRILSVLQKDDDVEKDQNNLSIYISENQILFSCKNIDLISRLVDSKYPDYTQIIPQQLKTKITLNAKVLLNAVKAASLFTKTGIYDISLSFNPSTNKIKIFSLNNQIGESESEIDVKIEGEEEKLILNYRYLLDGLQNINTENIIMQITDNAKPCIIKPATAEGEATDNYIYLIMPIKQ